MSSKRTCNESYADCCLEFVQGLNRFRCRPSHSLLGSVRDTTGNLLILKQVNLVLSDRLTSNSDLDKPKRAMRPKKRQKEMPHAAVIVDARRI